MVADAGWNTTSGLSILAGTLVAFGAVTLAAAAAGAAGSALGLDTDGISTSEWRQAGMAGAAAAAIVLFTAFFFGGYTAGRMSRRAGARHGGLVFVLAAVVIAVIAVIGWALSGDVDVAAELGGQGIPTDRDTWGDIGVGAAVAGLIAMLAGAMAGGIRGDRWHGRLADAVVEHREAERAEQAAAARRRAEAPVGTSPADDPEATGLDLRGDDATEHLSIEEERERSRP